MVLILCDMGYLCDNELLYQLNISLTKMQKIDLDKILKEELNILIYDILLQVHNGINPLTLLFLKHYLEGETANCILECVHPGIKKN